MKRAAFLGGAAAVAILWPGAVQAATLRGRIVKIARDFPGAIGVFARTLAPGAPLVAYRAYESFPTASIIKVLIMTTAFVADEEQPGALDATITFQKSDLIAGSDFMSQASDGATFSVRELIVPMIQLSDNTAANMLIEHFGVDEINDVGFRVGMTQTRLARKFLDWYAIVKHEDNVSTPYDMARLLFVIERGAHEAVRTIVSAAGCRKMVEIMAGQTDRDAIPAALPPGTPVANKTGEIEGTRNDVAIVNPFGDSPLILTVMTKDAYDYSASYDAIHAVTDAVYHVAAASH